MVSTSFLGVVRLLSTDVEPVLYDDIVTAETRRQHGRHGNLARP